MLRRWGTIVLILIGMIRVSGAEPAASVHSLLPGERLALEQIDQLVQTEQWEELIDLLVRTIDESAGRLIAEPQRDEFQETIVRWVPLERYLQDRLLRWGVEHPDLLRAYRQRYDAIAKRRLDDARRRGDCLAAMRLADELLATSSGDEALLLVGDLAMDRGWYWAAISYLRRIDARWQACAEGGVDEPVAALGWELVWERMGRAAGETPTASIVERVAKQIAERRVEQGWPFASYVGTDIDQAEVGLRLVVAYMATGERGTAAGLAAMCRQCYPTSRLWYRGIEREGGEVWDVLLAEIQSPLRHFSAIGPAATDDGFTTVGGQATRVSTVGPLRDLESSPRWWWAYPESHSELTGDKEKLRQYPAEQPVGRANSQWGGVHVAIHRGTVIVPLEDQLFGLKLATGQVWPDAQAGQPIVVAPLPATRLPETGLMPYDGQMQHTVSVADGRVAMRSGAVVSGWLPVMRPRSGASQVTVVDLQREGKLLPGYPLMGSSTTSAAAIEGGAADGSVVEFEGTPLLVGQRMYVGITQRDDALMTAAVRCYDVASGVMLFQSPIVSASRAIVTDSGQRAGQNRVARGLVSYREGTVFYHGDGGAIAALDAETGELRWVVRYPRAELAEGGYWRRRRGARRECSPVALVGPLAIAGPADSDRLLAVDASEGRLIWATAPGSADDCQGVLGDNGRQLIVGGDRLYWIERDSGRIVASWPANSTQQPQGSLAQPRGAGRGLLAGQQVYWPTADALWVFAATLGEREGEFVVVPERRIELQGLGLEGGNLAAGRGWLLIAGSRGIAAFRSVGVE